jgi:hypothetical protein
MHMAYAPRWNAQRPQYLKVLNHVLRVDSKGSVVNDLKLYTHSGTHLVITATHSYSTAVTAPAGAFAAAQHTNKA